LQYLFIKKSKKTVIFFENKKTEKPAKKSKKGIDKPIGVWYNNTRRKEQ